jgi:hypothetical protein
MLKLHETTKENIEHMNSKYKSAGDKGRKQLIFEPGELVWLHLRKDRFPALRKSKLMPQADGPFKVLERINDNAYKLDLLVDFRVSPTFNIVDLKPYLGEDDELESRTTQMQEGEDDEDIATNDTSTPTPVATSTTPLGPITHARARRLTHQEQWIGSKGKRHRASWIRTAGQTRLMTAATTSSGLCFGRSCTFWKAYQIYFPTILESPPYLFGVSHNPRFTTESFSATVLRHPNLAQRAVYQVESKTDAS